MIATISSWDARWWGGGLGRVDSLADEDLLEELDLVPPRDSVVEVDVVRVAVPWVEQQAVEEHLARAARMPRSRATAPPPQHCRHSTARILLSQTPSLNFLSTSCLTQS